MYIAVCIRLCFPGLLQLNLPVLSRPPAELSPSLSAQPPPLMGNVDPSKIDEIRRTVYVGNLNSQVGPSVTLSDSSGISLLRSGSVCFMES